MSISSVKTGAIGDSLLAGNAAFNPTAFDSIATASLSGATTVTFSSIPSTYKSLQLRFIIRDGAGYGSSIRFNSDTGNNYARHALGAYLSGGSMTVFASGTATTNQIGVGNWNGQTTNTFSVGIIDIHDYASTTKNKTVRAFSGVDSNGAAEGSIDLLSGLWINTGAVSSITFFSQGPTNFTTGSSVSLYGIN
jgi:hypothetical protein